MRRNNLLLFFVLFVLFGSATYAAENPTFFKGYTRMNEGSYDEAIIYFNLSLKSNPDYLPTYSHLALCYERKKEFQKAKETWTKYTEFDSYFKDTVITHITLIDRFLEAKELLADNQTDDALPMLEEIITLDKYPMSVLWLYAAEELTNIYHRTKSFPQAIPLYEKITLYYPKDVTEELLFQYAYSLQREKEFQKALDTYKRIDFSFSIKDKEKADKYKNLACLCYEGLGDEAIAKDEYKQAKLIYQKATQAFPSTENIPRLREKKQRAEEKLAFLYKTEADTCSKLKEYSHAMEFYKRIVDECPGSKAAFSSREKLSKLRQLEYNLYMEGFRHFINGKPEECRKVYSGFLQRFPQSRYAPKAQKFIGFAYADERRYAESIKELMKVVKNYPESTSAPDALERIGVYLWGPLGKTEKAEKVFRYLIKKYPRSNDADIGVYLLGCINLKREDYKKAYYYFRYLCKNYPERNLAKRAKVQIERIRSKVKK